MTYVGEVRHRRRVGWLLRVNRLLGARPRLRRLKGFAKEFSRENSARTATIATFSRWENGISAVTHSAVRRYEQLLDLPNLSMVSVIDTISRYMSPSAGSAPWLKRAPKPDATRIIEELVEKARGNDLMTAQDWDELTNLLSRNPAVILSPTKVWTELSDRLFYETSIADGTQWMARAEAFNRLVAHPAGALLGSTRKLRPGNFTAAPLRRLRQRINDRKWQKLERPSPSSVLAERVSNAAVANLGTTFNDPTLKHLVEETLCDPVFDGRLYAAFLLYATPYREPLGHALQKELLTAWHNDNARLMVTLLEALRILGGPEERRQVERLLLTPGVPSPVRDTAAFALGHIGGSSSRSYWASALHAARQRWHRTRSDTEASVLDRLVHSMGMSDHLPFLRTMATDPTLPDQVRTAANWWVTLPKHIHRSARV